MTSTPPWPPSAWPRGSPTDARFPGLTPRPIPARGGSRSGGKSPAPAESLPPACSAAGLAAPEDDRGRHVAPGLGPVGAAGAAALGLGFEQAVDPEVGPRQPGEHLADRAVVVGHLLAVSAPGDGPLVAVATGQPQRVLAGGVEH